MVEVKIADLAGSALDWAVAECEIPNDVRDGRRRFWLHPNNAKLVCRETCNHESNPKGYRLCLFSMDWSQGGPIIDREDIQLLKAAPNVHLARIDLDEGDAMQCEQTGSTKLEAAMRCFVASRKGETVMVPAELVGDVS